MAGPKLLVVTRHSPLPSNDGAGAYLFDLLSFLRRQGATIEIVWIKAEGSFVQRGWWRVPKTINSVARITVIGSLAVGRFRFFWWGPLKAQLLSAIKSTLISLGLWNERGRLDPPPSVNSLLSFSNGEPGWSDLPSLNETNFFRARLRTFQPDAVLANYCWLLPLIPRSLAATKFVLTHDVASHRLALFNQTKSHSVSEYNPATLAGESRLLELADVILGISEDDVAAFRGMVPGHAVILTPKAASIRLWENEPVRGRCLFVGGVNGPNLGGITWFLERVWPTVHQQHPEAVLHICGGICQMIPVPLPPRVILRGRVENLDAEYQEAAVVVVPLLVGTGVKIKLVEACSHGRACVTTPVGLQGLPFLRQSVIETADPEDFAQQVGRVIEDSSLRSVLQQSSLAAIKTHLTSEQCYGAVWSALLNPPLRPATASAPRTPGLLESPRTPRNTSSGLPS